MKNLQELPRLSDSISYVYLEHAIIEQENSAVVAIIQMLILFDYDDTVLDPSHLKQRRSTGTWRHQKVRLLYT